MKGDMTGWFEVRVDGPRRHHYRLGWSTMSGVLHPGSVRRAEETITWFVRALAAYLERL
jgi:hypothetical protein